MAGQKFNISFVIGAVDNVSLKVMEINEKINKAFEPFQKVGKSFGVLGAELGLNKLAGGLQNVGQKGAAVLGALKEAGILLVGTLATVGAAFNFVVRGAAATANEIQDASDRIGISTTMFQTLQYAATQSGVSLERLEPTLTKFSQVLGEASQGGSEAANIFQALGVKINDAHGMLLPMDEILPRLADKISKIENPSIRNAAAVKLFGKEGVKFVNILKDGSGGLEEFKKRATDLGIVLDDSLIKRGAALNNQMEEVHLMFMRLRDVVGAELFPIFKQLLSQLTEIFIANKPAIIAFGKAFAENLPSTLATIANLFKAIWLVVQPVLFVFEQLSKVFGAANLIFGVLALTIVGKLIFAIYALGGALVQLGLIAATTPIGLIAVGIGLVIAAIAALIIYWQPIKAFFLGLWDIISRSPIALLLGPLGILVLLGRQLYDNWQPFSELVSGIAAKISALAGAAGGFLGIGGGAKEAFGPPSGAGGVTEGIRNVPGSLNRTENQITIDLNGAPPGTRIKTEKAEAPLDFNMGFGMSTA